MKYDHLIFISLDTLRSDCIGANPFKLWPAKYKRGKQPRTDLLDMLSKDAAFFPNTISAAPYTSSSHATIFSGKWPLRHGLYEFFNRRLGSETIFTDAKRLGYRTLFKVDFPIILGPFLGFDKDADEYLVEDDEKALASVARGGQTTSFIHFGGIHIPYGFHNLSFGGKDYAAKVSELEGEIDPAFQMPSDQLVESYRSQEDLDLLLRYKRVVQFHYESKNFDRLFEMYLEGVDYFMKLRFEPFFDRLLSALKGKNYLIVLFGDHGEEYDEDAFGHFNSLSEGVIRVPLMFYGPDVAPGLHTERIRTADIRPTLLDRLGVPFDDKRIDGASLASTVWEGAPYPQRIAYSQTYISEAADFVAFQKEMLATGKTPRTLYHARFKEAVYDGDEKLVRQTHAYTLVDGEWKLRRCPARLTLETVGDDRRLRPLTNPQRATDLLQEMDRYNTIVPEASEEAAVTDGIRGELRSMGYRI
jgi:choline-sulfatase